MKWWRCLYKMFPSTTWTYFRSLYKLKLVNVYIIRVSRINFSLGCFLTHAVANVIVKRDERFPMKDADKPSIDSAEMVGIINEAQSFSVDKTRAGHSVMGRHYRTA